MAANIIRRFVIKQLSKDRGSGIMEIPNRFMVDQRQISLQNYLIQKGVNPNSIKTEGQLNTILQQIEKNRIATGLKKAEAQKKMAEIMDMKGRKINPKSRIMGGQQAETEKEIAERLKRQNKETVDRIKKDKDFDFDQDPEFASGGRAGLKLFPRASGIQSEQEVGPGIKVSERDLNYGITGLLQGNNIFGGAEIDKGKVKVDVVSPEGDTVFKDTISKDDAVNFILGMGDPTGEKFQIKTDKDFDNMQLIFKKKFNKGGRAGLSYLLAEDTNERTNFAAGGVDRLRRLFLKMLGAGAATTAAVKSGIVSFGGKKSAAKKVATEIIKTPNAPGKPKWFDALVTRVINEGEDVTKQFAYKERMKVHTKPISETEEVTIYRDLDDGSVRINYGSKLKKDDTKPYERGNIQRASNDPDQIDLIVREGEEIQPDLKTGKGGGKTKASFEASESEPRAVGGPEDTDIEFDGIREVDNVDDLMQDVSSLEEFATGKKLTGEKAAKAKKKREDFQKFTEDNQAQAEYLENKYGPAEQYYDEEFAKGGRAKMYLGGGLLKGKGFLRKLLKNLAKDRDEKASFMMRVMNPKSYQKALESAKGSGMYDRRTGILQSDKIKNVIKDAKQSRLEQLERYKGMAESSKEKDENLRNLMLSMKKAGASDEMIKDMANSLGLMFKSPIPKGATDETILELEQMIKNMTLRNTNRLTNANGGIARLLGE